MTDPTDNPKTPSVHADDNSIAVGGISAGGDISGNIHVGNVGYSVDQVSILIAQIQSTFQPKPFDGRCPYKGLDVFEEEDADLFFGREKLVDDLISRVKESRTVFVTGPSGSGKSSLVRAGLIHALKQGALKGSERWLYATMKPGRDPIGELGRVVSSLASSTNPEDEIRAKAMKDATIFARWCEIALKEGCDKRLVLFIDQFEEVFTQINNETERVAFLNLLTHAATVENGRVIILFSMRSDFVSNCATYPQLNALLNQQFVQIGAMQPEELVSAIAQPALRVGLRIEPNLIAQIINEMKGEPGALPLMQFALKDLFDSQQEKNGVIALTLNDYLQRGGIHKALERHADDSFSKLSKNEQELARSIFSGLIEIGRGTQDTRRTALFDELVPAYTKAEDIEAIVRKLADARLVTTDEQAGKDTVTISHEKLIEAWPWLKKLVNENRDVIALQNEIASDAKEWEDHQRDPSYLYSGARLVNANEQLKSNKLVLSGTAFEYVRASQARQRRGRLALITALSTIIAMLILAVIIFSNQSRENAALANQNEEIASTAQAASTLAVEKAEEAQKQADIALARQLAAQAQNIYVPFSADELPAVLLATLSTKFYSVNDARQILQNNKLTTPIYRLDMDGPVRVLKSSSDGKFIATGVENNIAIWESNTGKQIVHIVLEANVTTIEFSPDGKYLASGSEDHTVRVWEINSGKELARVTHDHVVTIVEFSPNGEYLISGGSPIGNPNEIIYLWEAKTDKSISRIEHSNAVLDATFSPNGNFVAISAYNRIYLWDINAKKDVFSINGSGVTKLTFSRNGKYIVTSGYDDTVKVIDSTNGEEISHMTHNNWVDNMSTVSPDSKYVVSASRDGIVKVWEVETGIELTRIEHRGTVFSVAFSPDGKYIVSAGGSNVTKSYSAHIWEASTGKEIATFLAAGLGEVFSPTFVSEDHIVTVGCTEYNEFDCQKGNVLFWKINTNTMGSDIVRSVRFSPDQKLVAIGGCDKGGEMVCNVGLVSVWDISTGIKIMQITQGIEIKDVEFSPDGKYILAGGCDKLDGVICQEGSAREWEIATGKEISRTNHPSDVLSVVYSPDGSSIVSAAQFDKIARVWESTTGNPIANLYDGNSIASPVFSPDGKYIVAGGVEHIVRVWEVSSAMIISSMTHDDFVYTVAFSPDGRYIVSGSDDQTARVWETNSGQEISRMIHTDSVRSVNFSPDGKYIVSGGRRKAAILWDPFTGKEIFRLNAPDVFGNYPIGFSSDSKYVVSGGDAIRVWDINQKKLIDQFYLQDTFALYASFSPNNKNILAGGNRISILSLSTDDLVANACLRVTRNLTRAEWNQHIGDALPYQAVCPNLPIEPEATPTATP